MNWNLFFANPGTIIAGVFMAFIIWTGIMGAKDRANAVKCPRCEHWSVDHSPNGWNCHVIVASKYGDVIRERRCSCDLSPREIKLTLEAAK